MSPQPPKFKGTLKGASHISRSQKIAQKFILRFDRRTVAIFTSVLILVQCAPALDRVFSPVVDNALFAAQPAPAVSYEFAVEPRGVIRAKCAEGMSRFEVVPRELIRTPEGMFQRVLLRTALCTEFGFRKKEGSIYVPSELLRADSDVVQGAWETKTYTGVPSAAHSDQTVTLQFRRLDNGQREMVALPDMFGEQEFQPIHIQLASPEEMSVVQNWRSDMLPFKEVEVQYEHPFLTQPVVLSGRLMKVRTF